jgi:oligopeptide/dipeptide ABC transporter ATP-binding protein
LELLDCLLDMNDTQSLLDVKNLQTVFQTSKGRTTAVDRVSFSLRRGEILGLVGASGCGKSTLALSILGLVLPPGRICDGSVQLDGVELRGCSNAELERIRGRRVGMVFQEPAAALNPVFRVGTLFVEALRAHRRMGRGEARDRGAELLSKMGIKDTNRCLKSYPFELSGGQQQRVQIALGLCGMPDLLIADEPTTALDVSTQAQILGLLKEMSDSRSMALLLISHDLAVVEAVAERIGVMYAGQLVEIGPTSQVVEEPLHPYTRKLLDSKPRLGEFPETRQSDLTDCGLFFPVQTGCRYRLGCSEAREECRTWNPRLVRLDSGREAACILQEEQLLETGGG